MCLHYSKINSEVRFVKLFLALTFVIGYLTPGSVIAQSTTGIWEGVFTEVQAARGEEAYTARCASCHAIDLRGNSNSPSLLGMSFMFLWEGRSVGELFTKMRTDMPSDQPGSLPASIYLDILTYVLQANGFPAGSAELTSNPAALNDLIITAQSAQ